MKVSNFNRMITLQAFSFVQDNAGGVSTDPVKIIDAWAHVEQIGGQTGPSQSQIMSDSTYKISIRYRRAITTNWLVVYENQTMKIDRIVTESEGYKSFMILYCSVSIAQTDWS